MQKPFAGQIVYIPFPTDEGGALNHYCLVLKVRDVLGEPTRLVCAYGSSKGVDSSCPRPGEFVLSKSKELRKAGLRVPTRFNFNRLAVVNEYEVIKNSGSVDLDCKATMSRMVQAYKSSGLSH